MTWHKFWKAGERYFDRFYSVALTLVILKEGGYLSISWTPVFVCFAVAFAGGIVCGTIASVTAPESPQTES